MTAMCKAMRELAAGISTSCCGSRPQGRTWRDGGRGREFKVQAVAKAERDAATQEGQNKAAAARAALN